jgi:hypothetical protein
MIKVAAAEAPDEFNAFPRRVIREYILLSTRGTWDDVSDCYGFHHWSPPKGSVHSHSK